MVRFGLLSTASAAAMSMCLALAPPAAAAPDKPPAAIAGAVRQDGLLPVYVDKAKGRILLSLPAPDAQGVSGRFLYVTALKTGLGSAPVGLDRARIGEAQVLAFRRIGRKVVAEFENHKFRAAGAPDAEQAAAREAFSVSTVWAGEVVETTADGRILVDISSFLTRDGIGVADALKQAGEPGYKLVPDLSIADPGAVKVFPENLEFEARQTYASDTPGPEVRNIAPDPKLITFEVRHSLVKLPEPGYQPRAFDPRTGGFSTMVLDYAAPLGEEIVQRYANRFRLEKTDPAAARSPVRKPIVFYVDRAAPEPIRSALVEGAAWWSQAFEAAGFIDAFQVKVLPEGADPLDVRYNVINWVDRATRGWSYGQAVVDPRTGEIVKGSVLLGALRVRQDMLIFEGLVGAHHNGTGGPNDPIQVSLARLRQLSAHEVGHSIGFAHNFAGSTQDRASVMDYPAPRVLLKDGRIDLSDAYGVNIGGWDKFTVDWLYGEDGEPALRKIKASVDQGQRYVTDVDSRPLGVAQPWGSLWDDGADPAAELTRMMAVRRAALDQFGLGALKPGEPVANLKRKYVPIYLLHRYQLEAASKLLGGVDFAYAVIGDGRETSPPVPAAQQRAALAALLATLDPKALDTPETLTAMLSSAQSGDPDRQYVIEVFATAGGPVFDPLVAAEVAAGLTLDNLLAPDRMARLVDQHRRDPAQLGVGEMLDRLIDTAFAPAAGRLGEISRRVQTRLVLNLANAVRDPKVSPAVGSEISARLAALPARLKGGADPADRAHRQRLIALLGDPALLAELSEPKLKPQTPPGMPIGDGDFGGR
ncbi:zinc-dependent metalloprotease [Phenylobacterium sp. NIBR 498073]|uniref:zinc-dependent metalloprotease n=1 Tax=Phenylobacterium sp. NIBR 498073 TaxID=3015177 RepID=UPI0022B4D7F9|nr:zinc-dependent metalloprotease [Phenylobacterium sp. NIBR 498073]WGU40124.1 zinc-dependent metalloprotease [Phenylobacterium sp. NIBR 498073]